MGLMSRAAAMLNRNLGVAAGVSVVYTRAADPASPVTITAESGNCWVGRTAFASNEVGKARLRWGDRDYLIAASALPAEPDEGDRITETVNGVPVTFEVCLPDTGEPAWRWSDPARTVYRLHVKEQGT